MQKNPNLLPRPALRRIFLGECLEAWKKEYLFNYWLREIGISTSDPMIRVVTAYVTGIVDRHLNALSAFFPDIHSQLAGSTEIYESVCLYPHRLRILSYAAAVGDKCFLAALMDIMQQCQDLYESLANESIFLNAGKDAEVFSEIAGDYRNERINWSAAVPVM